MSIGMALKSNRPVVGMALMFNRPCVLEDSLDSEVWSPLSWLVCLVQNNAIDASSTTVKL
jgi:hypothetical protein